MGGQKRFYSTNLVSDRSETRDHCKVTEGAQHLKTELVAFRPVIPNSPEKSPALSSFAPSASDYMDRDGQGIFQPALHFFFF